MRALLGEVCTACRVTVHKLLYPQSWHKFRCIFLGTFLFVCLSKELNITKFEKSKDKTLNLSRVEKGDASSMQPLFGNQCEQLVYEDSLNI